MNGQEPIRITRDDAYSPKVDEVLAREGSFGMRPEQFMGREQKKAGGLKGFLYSSVFYTALAGALGACAGWSLVEPSYNDSVGQGAGNGFFEGFGEWLLWPIIAGTAGVVIGSVEGIVSRNWVRAFVSGAIGLGIAFVGALVLNIAANVIYGLTIMLVEKFGDPQWHEVGESRYCSADDCNMVGYVIWMVGRALAWAPMGMVVALGPAIHMRSGKLAFNGIIGGLLGAFVGGLLFNPLASIFSGEEAWLSRGFGFTAIGLGAGVMIGLVENLSKAAWLHVQAGALAGKQFIIYKTPTVLGSSPKCEIYLFKDEAIEPKHAAIHSYGNRCEIEDLDTPSGTFVNGRKVKRQPLKNGDRIYIGETVLDYSERERE